MKSFLAGRKSLSTPPLRPPHAQSHSHGHTHRTATSAGVVRSNPGGPVVDVVKEGDKVLRIVVTCGCGEKIEVECLYAPGV